MLTTQSPLLLTPSIYVIQVSPIAKSSDMKGKCAQSLSLLGSMQTPREAMIMMSAICERLEANPEKGESYDYDTGYIWSFLVTIICMARLFMAQPIVPV